MTVCNALPTSIATLFFLVLQLSAWGSSQRCAVCSHQFWFSKVHNRSPAISAFSELQPMRRLKCLKRQFCKLQSLGILDYKYDVYRPDQTFVSILECKKTHQFFDHKSGLFSFQRIPQNWIQIPNPRTSNPTALLLATAGAFLASGHRSYISETCVSLTKSDFPINLLPQKNPLNAQLKTVCHLLALVGAHPIFYFSRIRVKLFLLM